MIKRKERADWFSIWLSRFNTSLLFVCKMIFLEASDVFFEVNTIHLRRCSELNRAFKVDKRSRGDLRVLQNVRYLGLVDPKRDHWGDAYGQWMKAKFLGGLIERCLTLPKLKECTFIYKRLPDTSMGSIREYIETANIEHEHKLEFVEVGVLTLRRSQGPTITFVNEWLKTRWALVKSRGHINVVNVYVNSLSRGICRNRRDFFKLCEGPAIWCALYDCTRAELDGYSQIMRSLQEGFRRRLRKIPKSGSHAKLPQNLPLREVSRQTVDSDVIEWLSELLLNLRRRAQTRGGL